MKRQLPQVEEVNYLSIHHTKLIELSATWQFFECGHGKRDGVLKEVSSITSLSVMTTYTMLVMRSQFGGGVFTEVVYQSSQLRGRQTSS